MASDVLVTTTTGTNSRTFYFGKDACFCRAKATRDGRCEYHAGMWEAWHVFNTVLNEDVRDTMDYVTAELCLEHLLFCEGFPEFEGW